MNKEIVLEQLELSSGTDEVCEKIASTESLDINQEPHVKL